MREAAFLKVSFLSIFFSSSLTVHQALGVVLPRCNPDLITNPLISTPQPQTTSTKHCPELKTFALTLPSSSPLYKTLTRIILCVNSIHFKVCQESIQLLLNERILSHYLYDSDVCRHLLDALVNALRQNRNHWNTSVRLASQTCLDQIFELME